MKSFIIDRIKDKYNELVLENNEQKILLERLKEFYKNKSEFTEMLSSEEKKIRTDTDILREAFTRSINSNDLKDIDRDIYVYMGSYITNGSGNIFTTDINKADYLLYYNIEYREDFKIIFKEEKENFENNNTIIKFSNIISFNDANKKYMIAQDTYFSELLRNSKREDIIEKIKKI